MWEGCYFSITELLIAWKCPYSECFWSLFLLIWTEYTSLYSVWMRENADQKNSEYEHFSHSAYRTLQSVIFYFSIFFLFYK